MGAGGGDSGGKDRILIIQINKKRFYNQAVQCQLFFFFNVERRACVVRERSVSRHDEREFRSARPLTGPYLPPRSPSHSFTYPLPTRVVWAPQMTSHSVSPIFLCFLLPSWTWRTPGLSFPLCSLPISSSVCSVVFPFHSALHDGFGQT